MSCRVILDNLQNNPFLDGYLSIEHGFMPPTLPLDKLSAPYSEWDQHAALIPELYFSNQTQAILSQMPLLAVDGLPDAELPRAALVLSLLAHAYWRQGNERAFSVRMTDIDESLPACIKRPWQAVNERLGRGGRPFQSFYDLFLNNFALRSAPGAQGAYAHEDVKIENLDVLVPSFDNQAERVFYMAFVEMHALASPLIGLIVDIEEAIEKRDADSPARVIAALEKIETIVKKCLKTLRKISPVKGNKNYCDPILWSKTIAIFAVPAPNYVQGGTSGAFAPVALILDALLNRREYDSEYGRYVMKEREHLLPPHVVAFVKETSLIDLVGFIKSYTDSPDVYDAMAAAYNNVVEAYAGPEGFLGKHMSKVFNYLGVATMVGRNQSTSGHERYAHKQSWAKVTRSLNVSRLERHDLKVEVQAPDPAPIPFDAPADLPVYTRLDLAKHHTPEDYWVVIDGYVYDLTDYLKIHPGGDEIMLAYAGQDVSSFFHSIPEHTRPRMVKMMRRYLIGVYQENDAGDRNAAAWYQLLETLIFVRAILSLQYHHGVDKQLGILFSGQTHTHFIQEHLAAIVAAIPAHDKHAVKFVMPAAWDQLRQMTFIPDDDLRHTAVPENIPHYERISGWYETEDLRLVDALIDLVLEGLETNQSTGQNLAHACVELINKWMAGHLGVIHHIQQQGLPLFGRLVPKAQGEDLTQEQFVPHGFSCPVAKHAELDQSRQMAKGGLSERPLAA